MKKSEKCNDKNCPVHGSLKTRGRNFTGTVISTKMQKSVLVEWERRIFLKKYERYEKKRSKVKAHKPECMEVNEGDFVKITECRPLSKTKNFVIVEVIGQEKGYKEKMEARDEGKVEAKKKEDKKPEGEENEASKG